MDSIIASVDFFASDILLCVFFFVIGLELIRELRVGDLRSPKVAALPAVAAVGGVIFPAAIFLLTLQLFGSSMLANYSHGWAIPTATDIAFSLAVLNLFKKRIKPAVRMFLMVLAVVDDIIAIVIIALVYSRDVNFWAALSALILITAWAVIWRLVPEKLAVPRTWKTGLPWAILLVAVAVAAWYMLWLSGIHVAICGVLLGLSVPIWATKGLLKTIEPFSSKVVVPFYALVSIFVSLFELLKPAQTHQVAAANEGIYSVVSSSVSFWQTPTFVVPAAIAVALVAGKPLGILLFAWIGEHLTPLRLFHGLKVRNLIGAALLGGIGFTVSFLIASLSYDDHTLIAIARVGVVIGSVLSAALGALYLAVITNKTNEVKVKKEK